MAPTSSTTRSFVVGETVHLRTRVSKPGTREPTDPASVVLTSLKRGSDVLTPATTGFTRVGQGDFLLVLPTAGLIPGEYVVVITVADGPNRISILTDRFALRLP